MIYRYVHITIKLPSQLPTTNIGPAMVGLFFCDSVKNNRRYLQFLTKTYRNYHFIDVV